MTDTRTQTEMVTFTLNGAAVQVRADHPHLLAALREELDITSPKDGCSPSGQCGCCTVLRRRQGGRRVPGAADARRRQADHDARRTARR